MGCPTLQLTIVFLACLKSTSAHMAGFASPVPLVCDEPPASLRVPEAIGVDCLISSVVGAVPGIVEGCVWSSDIV